MFRRSLAQDRRSKIQRARRSNEMSTGKALIVSAVILSASLIGIAVFEYYFSQYNVCKREVSEVFGGEVGPINDLCT